MSMVDRLSVTGVRSVEIAMADPARAVAFFTDVWRLKEVAEVEDVHYLRGSCRYHHILSVRPSYGPPRIERVVYGAASRAIVDRLFEKVRGSGVPCDAPGALETPGRGYGFGFEDPQGRALAIASDLADHGDDARLPDEPYKMAHVNFNEPDAETLRDFYVDVLGFRCVDHAGQQFFMNADSPEHSSIVICKAKVPTLNHLSFEMDDLDAVMRGAGRLRDNGYPIEWGVGRHGCANNCFAYFAGPEEIPIEYTSDVLQIDESYPFNGPDYWAWPEGRKDQWGVTDPHTKRWQRIQTMFPFAKGAFHLGATKGPTIETR